MPLDDPHAVPLPSDRLPSPLSPLESHELAESWRIHSGDDPLRIRIYPQGMFRFDPPHGEYPVTYVNVDRYAAYAEVFGNAREIPPSAGRRGLFRLRAERPLQVVAFDRAEVQKAFGLDLNVCSTLDYPRTQQWSLALHRAYPDADGIRYLGRHAVRKLNLCLFLDRCVEDLRSTLEGRLRDLRREGLIAAYRYHLVPRLFFP